MTYELESEKIYKAAQILNLNEKATMAEIKETYRNLVKKWHPDNCKEEPAKCQAKIKEIVQAYDIIMDYCNNYRYSFKKEDIIENLPMEKQLKERWIKRFGKDPLWGN